MYNAIGNSTNYQKPITLEEVIVPVHILNPLYFLKNICDLYDSCTREAVIFNTLLNLSYFIYLNIYMLASRA